MSRIGKLPINIPEGVEVKIDGNNVSVKGQKGELSNSFSERVTIEEKEGQILVSIKDNEDKNLWGLTRSLINNMVEGVQNGFQKRLKIVGVGYSAKVEGQKVTLHLGYSHPIDYNLPDGITASLDKDPKGAQILVISGIDKQLVGQVTSNIRFLRPPEPYKGKGIRYEGEAIKTKVGKTAKK
ncbi:50S ribosomal protein L6 [Candidatus Absconditicoccus praedator]|uniref:50S ribosomal protein L6 n=1 Tax=Candidatus Absconditicoccus praedator TaxID=2735562 RepID=UPI001E3BF448|nr:50S ribosomal protein L6 [Candidatus Absconditicoccus praedator]UFX82774.1 50S ribosomal protein L6 [Candidatus Absconditicoccus praedator]